MASLVNQKLDNVVAMVTEQRQMLISNESEKAELRQQVADLQSDIMQLKEMAENGENQPPVGKKKGKRKVPPDVSVN